MEDEKKKVEIFMPPNTLRAKVGSGPIGMIAIDPSIIKRAEAAVEDLRQEFDSWLQIDISSLANSFAAFTHERNAANAGALFRAAHDLRGQAQTFEYPLIARIAGSLAKLMDGMQSLEFAPLPLVTAHVNAIHVIHRDKIKDVNNRMALVLAEELEGRVLQTLQGASTG